MQFANLVVSSFERARTITTNEFALPNSPLARDFGAVYVAFEPVQERVPTVVSNSCPLANETIADQVTVLS
jgi:hypothetical protein